MDQNESPKTIGVLTIPDVTSYNPERINHDICSILDRRFRIILVGPERLSDRLKERFEMRTYFHRTHETALLRKALLPVLTYFTLLRFVRDENPDVVTSFGNLSINGLCCGLISMVSDTTSVVRVTSDLYELWRYQDGFPATIGTFIKNNVLGHLAVRFADYVITLGPVMTAKLSEKGISSEKIHQIPQPPRRFDDPDEFDVRDEYDITPDATLILYVGYFKKSKGPIRLIKTVEYVLERSEDIHFLIVGSGGKHESKVQTAIAEYERVHLAGWVNPENLAAYYQSADLFLQTSNTEGLPNVVLEALTWDVPVVASDSGGEIVEYVSNIRNSPSELGELLLNHEQHVEHDRLPEQARPDRNAELYLEFFDEITD